MRLIIIGSGLAGLTTAYFLAREKVDVTVFDQAEGAGLETSFANGGLLAPSGMAPWNSPGLAGTLLRSIGREHSPVLVRANQWLKLADWGLEFLANSRTSAYRKATLKNISLARYSQQVLQELLREESLEFDFAATGTLCLYRDQTSLHSAMAQAEFIAHAGVRHQRLDASDVVDLEPELEPIYGQIKGGIHFPEDASGDAHRFCLELHRLCERVGVDFRFRESVLDLEEEAGRVSQVRTDAGTYRADAYLIAAGSYSAPLVARLGLKLPVRPAKGYSITLPSSELRTRHPVLDRDQHIVVTPLGDRIRVAGTAEFAGFDTHIRPKRIDNLIAQFARVYPKRAASLRREEIREWTGLRPMAADGMPFLGATPIPNLYLNTGHGPSGWTLACGSGKSVSDLILRRTPHIDIADFGYARRA